MQIVSLTLHNIRSYTQAKIDFPTGIVLLSGDIGSGKSTTLLAIEFALFGLSRGELTGGALLRNGANEGSVELTFKIEENTHTIKRTLKRTKTSIEQDSGYIINNDVKTICTATELKARVLDILSYPQEILTKKNTIYRYTVYTPQEEMKHILLESPEDRLITLRKIFDIDKYERIKKNTQTYSKTLRERERALAVLTTDLEEKKKQSAQLEEEKTAIRQRLEAATPLLEEAKKNLEKTKTQLLETEKQKTTYEKLNAELGAITAILKSKEHQHLNLLQEIESISKELDQEPPEPTSKTEITEEQHTHKLKAQNLEKELRALLDKQTEIHTMKKHSEHTRLQVSSIQNCPLCKQHVTHEHKERITTEEKTKIETLTKEFTEHEEKRKTKETELSKIKQIIDSLVSKEKESDLLTLRRSHYEKAKERHRKLDEQKAQISQEIENYKRKIKNITEQISPLSAHHQIFQTLRQEHDTALSNERKLAIEHSTLLQKEQHLSATISIIQKDINGKNEAKKQLGHISEVTHFLSNYFLPLMDTMEKHVLRTVHHEFNTIFSHWFSVLIEETLTARLDENFTPIITQNGYDTDIAHLSGGERTACALAFRLALCKTINSLLGSIATKDILILDEPTEGFSSEQLDKMRDVLNGLFLSQIIIVSHEQKIEGMADHIVRVKKDSATSIID